MWKHCDPLLTKVLQFATNGRPGDDLKPFAFRKQELFLHKGCILWGTRVIILEQGWQAILSELHKGYPGMSKMKVLARMFVWWPGLDKDMEHSVQKCAQCQETQACPAAVPIQPWRWPTFPWTKLHIDYAGPLLDQMFLIIIDTHSKWIEVFPTTSLASPATIMMLQSMFACFGLPETIVSDNGLCFINEQFICSFVKIV